MARCVALGERECSIQRRHQKVLEESPSAALDPELRARMSEAAVAFARAIGYDSAGTAEFVLDGRDFYFLELNARIQVEHPVTELVTGVDLVREQLRIARGEAARIGATCRARGGGAAVRGGSADVPPAGRQASNGCACRPGIRVDAGVEEGDEIGTSYDPMIAKLIAYASSRDEATTSSPPPPRDGGQRRDDEPAVPPLARRAPARARGPHDDGIPDRDPPLASRRRARPTRRGPGPGG